MKVTLINYTKDAVATLLFTKNTRLKMSASSIGAFRSMTEDEQIAELRYIANTIKSSWEFIDFTFAIEGVTRAFTHQFVRNRTGSYAQQTMRVLDVDGFDYMTGPSIKTEEQKACYDNCMGIINDAYNELIRLGVNIEDARGVLPTNIQTNIVAKFNLRSLSDMMASRASLRTQGEYRDVIELMYQAVIEVYPWLELFLRNQKFHACKQLESILMSDYEGTESLIPYLKLIDSVRNN